MLAVNLDYPNTLVIRMRESVRKSEFVRITEINIKSMRNDFHLILQKSIIHFRVKFDILNDRNHHPTKLGNFYDNFHP